MPKGVYPRLSPEQRFWVKVDKTEDCWLWTGACRPDGYGVFWLDGKHRRAHIFSYGLVNGPVEEGFELDHRPTCPKRCVHPEHLRPATRKQNQENRAGPQRNNHSSGIRGVTWNKREQKWVGKVQHRGKVYSAGYWLTVEAAEVAVIELRNHLFTHNDLDRL